MLAEFWSSLGNLTNPGSKACLTSGQRDSYRCRDYVDYIRKQEEDRGFGNFLPRMMENGSSLAAGFSFAIVGTFILLAVKILELGSPASHKKKIRQRTSSVLRSKLSFGEILPHKRYSAQVTGGKLSHSQLPSTRRQTLSRRRRHSHRSDRSSLRESLTSSEACRWQDLPMFKDITFTKILTKDNYSTTFLCQHDVVGSTSSLKVFNKKTVNVHVIENEWRALLAVEERPYLVQGFALEESTQNWFIVMDYVPGETFMELWLQGYKCLPYFNVQFYLAELASALNWLHRGGVILRHLSADNVLLDKDGHVRILDFNSAVPNVPYGEETEETFETQRTTAPEMIQRGRYDYRVDAWSLGIFLYEILFGQSPFVRSTLQETEKAVIHDQLKANELDSLQHQELAHVLQGLLDKDPHSRMDDDSLRTSTFFANIDWRKVDAKTLKPPPLQNLQEGHFVHATSFQNCI